MFVRSPTGSLPSASASVCFSTGSDSPVSADSSTWRLTACARRPSAETLVACTQEHHVARHKLLGGDVDLVPVSHDGRSRRRHPAQGLDRALGPVLLDESEHGREQDDRGDHDRLDGVPERDRETDCERAGSGSGHSGTAAAEAAKERPHERRRARSARAPRAAWRPPARSAPRPATVEPGRRLVDLEAVPRRGRPRCRGGRLQRRSGCSSHRLCGRPISPYAGADGSCWTTSTEQRAE